MEAVGGMGVVGCLIEMRFGVAEADQATRLLQAVVERIEAKHGCHGCSVSRDAAEPTRLLYSEIWTAEPVFRVHVQSDEFRHVLAAMDMCCEEPRVTIGSLSGRPGLDRLRRLCSETDPVPDPGSHHE